MDGDACTVHCGYCGRCSSGGDTVTRTCAGCEESFEQSTDEPYTIHVLCDRCIELRDRRNAQRDEFFTRAQREWFRKASGL
jgi:hypothetical protein